MIRLERPYAKRPIRFLDLRRDRGWTTKLYWISARSAHPDPALVGAAYELARAALPRPAIDRDRYGASFLIVHQGNDGNYAILDWWTGENMLQHRVYHAAPGNPLAFAPFADTGIVACVWELHVMAFERQAWIDAVLANRAGPDLDAYYARRLSDDA
jgi:hypothetical protein